MFLKKSLWCILIISNAHLISADESAKKTTPPAIPTTPAAKSAPATQAPPPPATPVATAPASGTPTKKPTDERLSGTAMSWISHNPGKFYLETKINVDVDLKQITTDTSASGAVKAGTGRTVDINQTLNPASCLLIKDLKAAIYNSIPLFHSWFPDPFIYHVIGVNGNPVVYSYNKDGNEVITTLK